MARAIPRAECQKILENQAPPFCNKPVTTARAKTLRALLLRVLCFDHLAGSVIF